MIDSCPRCGSRQGFIIKEKVGEQLTLFGNSREDIMRKKKVPVCSDCKKWTSWDDLNGKNKVGVKVEITKEMTVRQVITGAQDIVERGGDVSIRNGQPVVERPVQLGNNNNTRCPDCGMENSVLEMNGRETCLKCGNDITGRVEVITWVR